MDGRLKSRRKKIRTTTRWVDRMWHMLSMHLQSGYSNWLVSIRSLNDNSNLYLYEASLCSLLIFTYNRRQNSVVEQTKMLVSSYFYSAGSQPKLTYYTTLKYFTTVTRKVCFIEGRNLWSRPWPKVGSHLDQLG